MKIREEQTFGIARKIKANMTGESWEHITHSVVSYEADVTELMPLIKKMNEGATKENKITVNSVMLKIITEGIKVMPLINSHLEFNRKLVRGTLKVFDTINISIPMVLPTGEMMTVNLRDMEQKSISEMDEAVKETVKKAQNSDINEALYGVSFNDTITGLKKGKVLQAARRLYGSKMPGKHKVKTLSGDEKKKYYSIPEDERLSQKDLEQGTITVSNLGSVYREGSQRCYMLQIVPPQTCVIALLSIRKEPVVVTDENGEDKIAIRQILPMTLAFDHRAYDYPDIIPFFRRLDEIFANPEVVKNWK
ncbi:MAG: 2-oxo acid dehydrogenase subunit E2 [Eubacterium sp.]|nr:2-oxo acid dehydrogenase subunit E2 [Eubacterium sp.]MBR7072538.1 2-oxo acid dehydrogenase subunit E2 [Eubacterium sp.]